MSAQGQHDFATGLMDALHATIATHLKAAWDTGVSDSERECGTADALALVAAEHVYSASWGDMTGPVHTRFRGLMRNRMRALADADDAMFDTTDEDANVKQQEPKPTTDSWGRPIPSGRLNLTPEQRSGLCYRVGYRTMQRTPVSEGWTLVVGNFKRPDNTRYGHCWLEKDDTIYCPTWDASMRKDYAEVLVRPRVHARFTRAEIKRLVYATGVYYGPDWVRELKRNKKGRKSK